VPGFVQETRDDTGTRPRTTYALTPAGRKAFKDYVDVLEAIVRSTKPN
jgi:DNA-binding PadR family transcriptional regulator